MEGWVDYWKRCRLVSRKAPQTSQRACCESNPTELPVRSGFWPEGERELMRPWWHAGPLATVLEIEAFEALGRLQRDKISHSPSHRLGGCGPDLANVVTC